MAFEECICAALHSIWTLFSIDIAEVTVSLPQLAVWHCFFWWSYSMTEILLHHSLFGLVLLCYKNQKSKLYTLQFISSRYCISFMQWLSSEDKLSTNNPIILEFVNNKYAILYDNNFVTHEELNRLYALWNIKMSELSHTEMTVYMQDSRHICIEQKYDHDETLD